MNEENMNTNKNTESASGSKKKIITAVIIIVAALILIGGSVFGMSKAGLFTTNKYNKMGYVNISGRTLEDVAADADMTVDEFKEEYQLPEDMTGDTYESAAFYNIPTGKIAEMYGMEFSDIIELLALPDTVTETTPWGEAEGEAPLKNYVGEESVDAFKEEYELGDDVTGDTKWKDIRNIVDQKALDQRLAQEEEAENQDDTATGNELSEEDLQALLESATQAGGDDTQTSADAPAADAGTQADGNAAPVNADAAAAN